MKKTLIGLVVTLLAIAVVLFVGAQYFLGSAVVRGVNTFGPRLTQTEVKLSSAKISAFSGVGTLTGLQVANPAGWTPGNAISVGTIHIDLAPFSVFGDHIVINELIIDQPVFAYETQLVASNINDLLKNIEKATGAGEGTAEKNGKPVKIEVKKFSVRNGKVSVGLTGAGAITVPLPTIELENVGTGKGGVTSAEFALQIMGKVSQSVVTAAVQAAAKGGLGIGGAAGDTVKQAGQILQGVLGGGKK